MSVSWKYLQLWMIAILETVYDVIGDVAGEVVEGVVGDEEAGGVI